MSERRFTRVSELRTERSTAAEPLSAGDGGSPSPGAYGDAGALYPGAILDGGQLRIPIGPDSSTPAYLTLNSDGTVGADFSGHIEAQGLDLPASTEPYPLDQNEHEKVRWIDQGDGSVAATVSASDDRVASFYTRSKSGVASALGLIATNSGRTVLAQTGNYQPIIASDLPTINTPSLVNAVSSFLKVASLQRFGDYSISFGQVNLFFPGASLSDQVFVNHSLGRVPSVAFGICTYMGADLNNYIAVHAAVISSTQISLRGQNTRGANIGPGSLGCFWLAIG